MPSVITTMKRRLFVAEAEEGCVSSTVKRSKVQAQRKFAQGSNNYAYCSTKIVSKTPDGYNAATATPQISSPENEECELNTFSNLPTVDDFLTFLCFRETDVLPERLNYLNSPVPQPDVLVESKKLSKMSSGIVALNHSSVNVSNDEQNKRTRNKVNGCLKSKKLVEYKLFRSCSLSNKSNSKTARSLTLRHNQRLRSKSVVRAKVCESKLQNSKKNSLSGNLISSSLKAVISITGPSTRTTNRKQTDAAKPKHESPIKRVTRQNTALNGLPEIPKKAKTNSSVKKTNRSTISEVKICLEDSFKNSTARLSSLPKFKANITNDEVIKEKLSTQVVKPTTRSTRCNNLQHVKVKSRRSSSVQHSETSIKSGLNNDLQSEDMSVRTTRSGNVQTENGHREKSVVKSTRPSRRTKEAAALYMELLGKELLCPDNSYEDDDCISTDSFPELPNTEQHMRREREFKEQHQKSKVPLRKNTNQSQTASRNTSEIVVKGTRANSHSTKVNAVKVEKSRSLTPTNIEVTIKDLTKGQRQDKKVFKKRVLPDRTDVTVAEPINTYRKNSNSLESVKISREDTKRVFAEKKLVIKSSLKKESKELISLAAQTDLVAGTSTEIESSRKNLSPKRTELGGNAESAEKKIFRKSKSELNKKSEAFSLENENSVYAFEPDLPTTSPPFRRLKPVTPPSSVSNSIAVQVNFGNDVKLECSSTGDTQVSSTTDRGSDRVFYIPIQTSTVTSTLGVAVKLGTDGPNKKIIMSATLITNSPTFTTNTNTSTSVSAKTSIVETTSTQTETMKLSNREQPTRRASCLTTTDKLITPSLIAESISNKKAQGPSTTKVQSVKILKLNKNKKVEMVNQATNTEIVRTKSDPMDLKSQTCSVKNKKICTVKPLREDESGMKEMSTEKPASPAILEKPDSTIVLSKVTTSMNGQDEETTSSSTSSSSLSSLSRCVTNNRASTSNGQSVKIVKVNKNKKMGESSGYSSGTDSPVLTPIPSTSADIEFKKTKPKPLKVKPEVKTKTRTDKCKNMKQPSVSPSLSPATTGEILEAPTFHPTEEEFNDPLDYLESIRRVAEKFGLCRIVPPSNFRPECKVADEMRFTAYNQYVHKMLHRWGPNVKEMLAIKKFLATQNIQLTQAPWIGGMEVDLPRLYQTVQQCGGLSAVIEKERWQMVADSMRIPKLAQDRITKLDDIYCKYLLPYDILSHEEREKLFEDIEKEWAAHLKKPIENEIFEDVDECILKGRTMPLSCFYRIARNTMMMCFGSASDGQPGPSTETVEEEFWNHVSKRDAHICVHSGSIDSGTHGYGFSMAKNSAFRKHAWNLKVLTNNSASVLRFLGPLMGVTVPTLHVGMLYSAFCWYRDPHGLPWIEYLHTGADKIWYGIPDEHSQRFREAMQLLVPRYCHDKKIWLPSDTAMIPPPLLTAQNVTLSRVVQHPGQFIVIFPKAFTSSISTGYLVSESVYFAQASWLDSAKQVFEDMRDSCEPPVFSLEHLLVNIAEDARPTLAILTKVLPLLQEIKETETSTRAKLKERGVSTFEKLNVNKKRKFKNTLQEEEYYECDICHANLFISLVADSHNQNNYCLGHAVSVLQKRPAQAKYFKLLYAYTEEELGEFVDKVKSRIEMKNSKKLHCK